MYEINGPKIKIIVLFEPSHQILFIMNILKDYIHLQQISTNQNHVVDRLTTIFKLLQFIMQTISIQLLHRNSKIRYEL